MEKIAFISDDIVIFWRPLLLTAGTLTAVFFFLALYLMKARRGVRALVAVPTMVALGLLGARLVHWYCRFGEYDGLRDALTRFSGGFALLGVFAGCLLGAFLLWLLRIAPSLGELLDCASIAGCAGIGVGRLAYFFDAADRGFLLDTLRELPWAYPVTNSVSGEAEYRLATFLLQAMWAGMLFVLLLLVYLIFTRRARLRPGDVCLLFLLLYFSAEIVLDSTRYDALTFRSNGFVNITQVFGALTIVFVAVLLSIRMVRRRGMRKWYVGLWLLIAVMLGTAGYMEYNVQRHASQAMFSYCTMSAALGIIVLSSVVMLAITPAPRVRSRESVSQTAAPAFRAERRSFFVRHRLGCLMTLLAATLVGALIFLGSRVFVLAGGQLLLRSAAFLDLQSKSLTQQDYLDIQQALPDCTIVWNVPIQGKRYPSTSTQIEIVDPGLGDSAMLRYFSQLKILDARRCADLPGLEKYLAAAGMEDFPYVFTVGGVEVVNTARDISLENASIDQLRQALSMLHQLQSVSLEGQLPSTTDRIGLIADYPQITFNWMIPLGNRTLSSQTETLDLSNQSLSFQELQDTFDQMPGLCQVNLLGCGLSNEQMLELAQRYPQCDFLGEVSVAGKTFRTDATELDLSGQPVASEADVEKMLPCFHQLTRVNMSGCGLDDETMDALNRRYEDIRFVWTVKIQRHDFPTDSIYFYPWKMQNGIMVTTEDLYPLRYCPDIECVDIGHMWEVENCDWVEYMPNLKYLIIGETGITDISPLSSCKNLIYLEMFTINVTDLSPLLGCTALQDLNLGRVYASPEPLKQMTWLKNLWWANADGLYGRPCSGAKAILMEALPDTHMQFDGAHPSAAGWRQLPNYFAMRDLMGMYYLP